jgi:hypothetical protein
MRLRIKTHQLVRPEKLVAFSQTVAGVAPEVEALVSAGSLGGAGAAVNVLGHF